MSDPEAVKQGKKNRAAGKAFELKVRVDLEKKGWIVMRNTNDVEWPDSNIELPPEQRIGIFKQAKPKWVFNPLIKRRIPISGQTGFPDFICHRHITFEDGKHVSWDIQFVECKVGKYLSQEEKDKIEWIRQNLRIPVIIASKPLTIEEIKTKEKIIYDLIN